MTTCLAGCPLGTPVSGPTLATAPGNILVLLSNDARHVSRDIQEEALRRGLIPYLP